jgi:hypothetical protein
LDVWFTFIAGSNRAQLLDRVLQSLPPRLGKWLLSRFSEPGAWLAARLAFTRTNAAWAMVGHVLGLGDRHGDNIMIHGLTGALFCCFGGNLLGEACFGTGMCCWSASRTCAFYCSRLVAAQ